MEQAIYYPGFEVKNHDWLKFALLYIDTLNPIIPPAGDKYVSDTYRKLTDDAGLIVPHRPDYREGEAATLDAIEVVERILGTPRLYSGPFRTSDVTQLWKNPHRWSYTLFRDKFTYSWEHFCIQNRMGRRDREGLSLDKSLAFLYMSILAHAIGDSRGVSPITDHAVFDRLSIVTRKATPLTPNRVNVARGIIKLQLPANLRSIDLERVIEFRQRPGFKKRLHAFHTELNAWISDVEEGQAKADFFQTRGGVISDFSDEIVSLGTGVAGVGLSVWMFLSDAHDADYIKLIAAGSGFAIGSTIALRKAWKNTESKRLTRKYLAQIKNLQISRMAIVRQF